MPRSVKKGPFVDNYLLKKVEEMNKSGPGRNPTTPWGIPTMGYKTRKNKRTTQFIVNRRKK